MAPKKQEGGSELAEIYTAIEKQNQTTHAILCLLQGDLGKKGMVHKLDDVHDTIQLHKKELERAEQDRVDIRKDVSSLKKDRMRFVTIVSTAGLLGTEGLKKLAAIFGSNSGQ